MPHPMTQFQRLLTLLALLPTEPMRNVRALARDLGCAERTIQRNLALLASAGLAHYDRGRAWLVEDQIAFVERLSRTPAQRPQMPGGLGSPHGPGAVVPAGSGSGDPVAEAPGRSPAG